MVAGGYCFANSRHSRSREIARSGAKERGRRGDSISYLTCSRDASWWLDFDGEDAAAVPPDFCSGVAALGRGGLCHTLKYLILGCEYLSECVHLSIGFFENFCGRTNLNYSGSSMQVLSFKGSNCTSNGVNPWPVW
jgi:hypothetical protein